MNTMISFLKSIIKKAGIGFFTLIIFFLFITEVIAKPLVAVTIDAETMTRGDFALTIEDQYDLKVGSIKYGISEIMNLLEKHHAKGVFFYDAYEYAKDGDSVKRIAQAIDRRGHDVELHTHPQWAYDPDKKYLHDYGYEDQKKIIAHGKKLLEKWTGKPVVAHRAGAYGADFTTLKALSDNHIYLDSSFFYKHPWCKLNSDREILKKNYYSRWEGVIQVPVNVFLLDDVPKLYPHAEPISYVTKYDINPYVDEKTLYKAIDQAIRNDFSVIVLFLHSFTFISYNGQGDFRPDQETIRKFDAVLDYTARKGLQFVTFKEIEKLRSRGQIVPPPNDALFRVKREISTAKYALKRVGVTRNNLPIVAISGVVVLCGFVFVFIYLIRRKRIISA